MLKKLNSNTNNDPNLLIHRNRSKSTNSFELSEYLYHSDRHLGHSDRSLGFTLLELLLSVTIISLLAGLSLSVYRTLIKKNDLDITANSIVSSLRRAQILSQSIDGNTTWGVKAQNKSIVIFKGASFASRDTNFDEVFDISSEISISGVTEVVYAKFSGLPQITGTINLSTENDSRSITINEKGTITY